jgi:predicted dehydrogenase
MKRVFHRDRRLFLKQLGAVGVSVPMFADRLLSAPPSNRVRHASFGAAGMAGSDVHNLAALPDVQVVCAAEVDLNRLEKFRKTFPESEVKVYQDWRELLDKEHKNLDSVNVGTPDHMHAPIAMSAMQLGLHAYVQKPLCHDIYEVRRLTEFAREKKLVTQMGIQIHSSPYYRIGVETIRSGAIGKIKETYSWSSKKWSDSNPLPDKSDPVPEKFNWDWWLGVCASRPYVGDKYYHPSNWRKRLDFGTGTFGDMGCHIFDPVFESLALTAPITVRSEGPAPNQWNWAENAAVEYVFPGTEYTAGPTVAVHWYDGDQRPPKEILALLGERKLPGQGSIFVGTKGAMVLPHIAVPFLLPEANFKDFRLPRNSGESHWKQFIEAVRGNAKTTASFDYSGPLTEAVLLGGVATRFPKTTLEWDAPRLAFKNQPEASRIIRRPYRQGWEVKDLS